MHSASHRHSCGPVLQGSARNRQSKVHRSPRGATCRMLYANSSHVRRTLSPSALPGEMADIITAYHGRSENSVLCAAVGRLLTQREPNHKPISNTAFFCIARNNFYSHNCFWLTGCQSVQYWCAGLNISPLGCERRLVIKSFSQPICSKTLIQSETFMSEPLVHSLWFICSAAIFVGSPHSYIW